MAVLSEDRAAQLVEWMRQRCCSDTFDPMDPEFQAAIAVLAASDEYRQKAAVPMDPADNVVMVSGKRGVTNDDVRGLAQVLMYRQLTRGIPLAPSVERVAMSTLEPDNLDGAPGAMELAYLTPHFGDAEFETMTSANRFRNEFVTGAGHPRTFLVDRRLAVLSSASNVQALTNDFRSLVRFEMRKLQLASRQWEERDKVMRYELDPLGNSLPDYGPRLMLHREMSPRIAPQHLGIYREYDISAAMDTSQKTVNLRRIIGHANRFLNELGQRMEKFKLVQGALEKYKKDKEKEKNRAKRAEERIRWDLLKQKDMAKYRETVKQMKDQRIQLLLDQTDHYMMELRERIRLTHSASSIGDPNDPEHKYDWDLKLPESVTQPDHLTGQLKQYQVKGLQWMVWLYQAKLNGILADEMGLGKTIQTIALLAWLFEKCNDSGPHLVCAPLSTLSNWEVEFKQWFPQFVVIRYTGSRTERKELEKRYISRTAKNCNVILTSYEFVVRDKSALSKLDYSYIIIDEAHKLKNHHGKLSQTLTHHYSSKNRLLLTGTPLQNNPRELWSLLNFILPTIFDDHSKFEDWFAAPFAKAGEDATLSQEETWVVLSQLHAVLRPFMFRRLKEDVADQLPDKREATILCPMSAWQHSMYITMEDHSLIVQRDMKVVRMDNKVMQCRKICNHPYLFQDKYYLNSDLIRTCGKFELLDRILPKLHRTGHRVLIFSQMTELLDLLEDLLRYLNFTFLRLDGSTKGENRQQLMDDFNAPDSEYFIFLLSTRAGGLGLNLQSADTVIIYDNDWNPFADKQACGRAHRIGQSREVLVLNLSTPDSVERRVLKVQNEKRTAEDMIIGAAIFNDESCVDDRKAVYQAVTAKNQSGGVTNVPNDSQINKFLARTPEELDIFEEMDQERDERYQREWEKAGHTGEYPRLVTYEELPDYLKVPVEELIKEEEIPAYRRSRSKNQLSMLDNITDSEYTRFVEEGRDPNDYLEEIEETRKACKDLVTQARSILGDSFDILPTREELPRYYEIIKNPITFKTIKSKVRKGEYMSVDELKDDLRLMATNAVTFNAPESLLHKYGQDILKLIGDTVSRRSGTNDIPEDSSLY